MKYLLILLLGLAACDQNDVNDPTNEIASCIKITRENGHKVVKTCPSSVIKGVK